MLSSENLFTRYRLAIPIAAILAIVAVLIFAGTSAAQTATLQTPQDVTVQSSSGTSVTITWTPVTGATEYVVRVRRNADDEYVTSKNDNTDPYTFSPSQVTGTTITVSGLETSNDYTVAVRAIRTHPHNNTVAASKWSHSVVRQRTTGAGQTTPPPTPTGEEGNSGSQITPRAATDIVAGTPFTADGYVFELIPHTEFIMAWKEDTSKSQNKGQRAPKYDINFSCVNQTAIRDSKKQSLKFNAVSGNKNDELLYGNSSPQTSYDLVPATAPPALTEDNEGTNDFRRRRVEDCTQDDERSDIVAFANYLYTTNISTSIIEAWALSGRGTVYTRKPELDMPIHSEARENFGFGIFKDTAHSSSNEDYVWMVHAFGTNRFKFIPHSREQLRPIDGASIDYPDFQAEDPPRYLPTKQAGDVYISDTHAYIQPPQRARHFQIRNRRQSR